MDKNTLIGLLLMFALFLGFSFYTTSQNKAKQEQQIKAAQELIEKQHADSAAQTATTVIEDTSRTASKTNATPQRDMFSSPEIEKEKDYVVETDKAYYTFAQKGGYIKRVELKDIYSYTPEDSVKQPLVLFDGDDNYMNIVLQCWDHREINSADFYFLCDLEDTLKITGSKPQTLSLKLHPNRIDSTGTCQTLDNESYIEYLYTFNPQDFRFGFRVNFKNMEKYLYPNKHSFSLNWDADLNCVEKNYEYEKNITSIYYMDNLDNVDNLDERAADKKEFSSQLKWISFKQQFFTSTIIADNASFSSGSLEVTLPDKNEQQLLKQMDANLDFEIQDINNGSFDMSMFIGPNQYKLLKRYDMNLERQVPLGWGFFLLHWINRGAVIPIFNWLEVYGISYGIIILILTIIVKIVLFPVAYKTYLSSARMRVLKPEIETISARYPKPDDAMKKQQAIMTLYKKAGVSPAAGCLPMLLQMPILIAMFRFFPSAYELRQQPFLWADDLSTYDSILDLGFNIPFYGDHVSLFTLLMTAATLVYTWLNNKQMSTGNDDQQRMMKIMMYIMPIMFLGMFNSFSSALTYYYLLVNLITFLQMWIFRISVNEEKLKKKMQTNMAKPIKKSKWQLKLEEMAKQQQQMQKNARR